MRQRLSMEAAHTVEKKILIFNYYRLRRSCGRTNYTKLSRLPTFLGILIFLLRILGYKFKTLSEAAAAPAGKFVCLTFDGAYRDVASRIFPILQRKGILATIFPVTGQIGKKRLVPLGVGYRRKTAGLTWTELKSLVDLGWEVGVQGHNYVNLTERSQRDQHAQIQRSKQLVEDRLGVRPVAFSYPFGACDASTVKYLREEGFKIGVTMRMGVSHADHDPFQLERIPLTGLNLRQYMRILRLIFASVPPVRERRFNPLLQPSSMAKAQRVSF